MGYFWDDFSITALGKSEDANARQILVTNLTKSKQGGLVLMIKTSQLYERASVNIVSLQPNQALSVSLPHVPQAGSELAEEEIVTYALLQDRKEQCTTSATVRMLDHSRFSITAEQGDPVDFTKTFVRRFIVHNNSSVALPATATLGISRTTCFQLVSVTIGEVASGGSKVVDVPHRPLNGDISLETVEECTSYTLRHQGVILATIDRRARMYEYSAFLLRYQPSNGKPTRVLLCGRAGLGKTSFVRSVCSALDPDDAVLCNLVPISAAGNTGTDSYHLYPCGPAVPFAFLYDTWGHQPENYKGNEYLNMIDGVVEPGSLMDKPTEAKEANHKIHSIVLFVGANNQGLEREAGIVTQALKREQNPTIVMSLCETQLDLPDVVKFRKNPNQLPKDLEDKLKRISSLCPAAVLHVAPYVGSETSKIFERDRLTLRVLASALHAGKTFQQFH